MSDPHISVGRRVLFIGGPEAGNALQIPDSYGNVVENREHNFVYQIHPFRVGNDQLFIAYEKGNHILNAIVEMFREYAPAAQIKRQTSQQTYRQMPTQKPAP